LTPSTKDGRIKRSQLALERQLSAKRTHKQALEKEIKRQEKEEDERSNV